MSTEQAFNDLENSKSIGYEADLKIPGTSRDDFYCKICKSTFEFGDPMVELLDRSVTDRYGNTTWIGTCERCWL